MSLFLFCLDDYSNICLRNVRSNAVTFKKAVIFTATAMRISNLRFCTDVMLVFSFSVIKNFTDEYVTASQVEGSGVMQFCVPFR